MTVKKKPSTRSVVSHRSKKLSITATEKKQPSISKKRISKCPKNSPTKLDMFSKAGLIGCLNDTGITSKNYKNEFFL